MNELIKILTASAIALTLSLTVPGCSESSDSTSDSTSGETHSADDGHDHAEGEQDDPGAHAGHDHGEMRSIGTITAAGTTIAVSLSRDIKPSSEVYLDLEVESGPTPAAVRFWIGDEAGTGALRAKADGHDNHFHGLTESPANLDGASLWIEIEMAGGERVRESMPLQ